MFQSAAATCDTNDSFRYHSFYQEINLIYIFYNEQYTRRAPTIHEKLWPQLLLILHNFIEIES